MANNDTTSAIDAEEDSDDELPYSVVFAATKTVGAVDFIVGLICMFLTGSCIVAIYRSNDLSSMASYKMMMVASFLELLVLSLHGVVAGLVLVLGFEPSPLFWKIVGAFENGGWFGYSCMVSVLALNRAVILWSRHLNDVLFGKYNRVWFWIGFSLAYGAAWTITMLTPQVTMTYLTWGGYNYFYVSDTPEGAKAAFLEQIWDPFVSIFTLLCYFAVALGVIKQRQLSSNQRLSSVELRALVSILVMGITMAIAVAFWYLCIPGKFPLWIGVVDNICTLILFSSASTVVLHYIVMNDKAKSSGPSTAVHELSEGQIEEIREAFSIFDKDGNGTITLKELGIVLRSLGQNPTEAQLQEMINEADVDGSGTIDFDEFVDLMARKLREQNDDDDIRAAFRVFCRDGTDTIDVMDLRMVFTRLREFGERVPYVDVEAMVKQADADGDGRITYEEFYDLMAG